MKKILVLLLIVGCWLGYRYTQRPVVHPAGVLIAEEPRQGDLLQDMDPIPHRGFSLRPLAYFSAKARLLHKKKYRYDRQAKLAPIDFALGWGRMSDQTVLDRMKISQSMRFFWYRYQTPPIPEAEIVSHATNVHIIPANKKVAAHCRKLRPGALIQLDGKLVEVRGNGLDGWRSSLKRDDTGNGACELLWLERIVELPGTERRESGTQTVATVSDRR